MSSRSSHVRTKVTALLLSLVALWAFAAFVTIREGLNLLSVSTLDSGVGRPADAMIAELQEERRLSVIELGADQPATMQALLAQRVKTDAAVATFREQSGSNSVALAGSDGLGQRIADTVTQLDRLAESRRAVDQRTADRTTAAASYTTMIETTFLIFDSLATLDDKELAKDVRTLIVLSRAREVLAQEDSLLAGALAAQQVTPLERQTFTQLVGTQRYLYAQGEAELPPSQLTDFQTFTTGPDQSRLRDLEDRVINGSPTELVPVSAGAWESANQVVFARLRDLEQAAADDVVARATPAGAWVVVRLALAAGLGLIAVIASVIVSITTARSLIRQLERLRNAALELASKRLPRVVERLQQGERVDIEHEAPPLDFGRDEIGQVGQAFNTVQETAIRVAVEQAELRRGVRDVFLSLARRSQALLHRQLALLDAMERRATEPEELSELFRIDHLATRMRRNAENLIVLSGATAGRAWRKPVAMLDVLRGALAEVEDYTRVEVLPVGDASLQGRAVGDVIHLLAELIENAVSFSPPESTVRVGGSRVGNGFAVEIEDRGLGMSPGELAAANRQIQEPPEFKLTSTARLGLYVVGHLAHRHNVRVRLTESPYGGITAVVLLPNTVMADEGALTDGHLALPTGRHRQEAVAERLQLAGASTGATSTAVWSGPVDPEWHLASNSRPGRFVGPDSLALPELTHPDGNGGPEPDLEPPADGVVAPDAEAAGPSGAVVEGALLDRNDDPVVQPTIASTSTSTEPGNPRPVGRRGEPTVFTPSGLPWRERETGGRAKPSPYGQTSGAAVTSGETAPHPRPAEVPERPLEGIRSMLSSYRAGTLQGRIDSARLLNGDHPVATTTPEDDPTIDDASIGADQSTEPTASEHRRVPLGPEERSERGGEAG